MQNLYKIRLFFSSVVFILAILGITGIFYPVKIFDIQFAPLLQRIIVDFSLVAIILFLTLITITLIFGRIYCSLLCPFGIFQEIISLISRKRNKYLKNIYIKYFITAIATGTLIGGSVVILRYIEPYTYFTSACTLSKTGIIAIVAVILIVILSGRFFCTNICPVGTILGIISKFSIFRIYINKEECLSCGTCERNCPSGCINADEEFINNENCIKCLKCINLCPKNAIQYGIKPKENIKFNLQRRKLITASAAIIVLAAAFKTGMGIMNNAAKKIKNVILPPGAINEQHLFNKCLNCNLCINACPNGVIKKADDKFGAIHIDYENRGYCKFDCIECSKVCPSGAITKISLSDKQNLRIAMAVVDSEKCMNCGLCVLECPMKAITKKNDGTSVIDPTKCIGCGACTAVCNFNAINIFAVNEQKII